MDLSTSYLGLALRNPLVASASPISNTLDGVRQLADAGVGAIVLYSLFEEQLRGLAEGGIDVVLIETMSDLGEVQAAVAAARSVVPDLPVIATMSFDTNLRTMMGVSPADAVKTLEAAGVDAVGANCGRGPAEMEVIASEMADARSGDVLLVAQSNAGLPVLVGDHFEYDVPADELAVHASRLHEIGIDLIGACCGSTPAHTEAIRTVITA